MRPRGPGATGRGLAPRRGAREHDGRPFNVGLGPELRRFYPHKILKG